MLHSCPVGIIPCRQLLEAFLFWFPSSIYQKNSFCIREFSHMTDIQCDTVSPSDSRVHEQHFSSVTLPWPRPVSALGWWIREDLAQEVLVTQVCESCCGGETGPDVPSPSKWAGFSPFYSHPRVTEPIFPIQSSFNWPETVWPANCHNPDWIKLKNDLQPFCFLHEVTLIQPQGLVGVFLCSCVCFPRESLLLLLPQLDSDADCCQLPQPGNHGNRRMQSLTRVALSTLGATILFLLYKAASGKVYLQMYRNVWCVPRLAARNVFLLT